MFCHVLFFSIYITTFLNLGLQSTNVYTIKENSVTTATHNPCMKHDPSNHKDIILSPFARSLSFNNYNRYRNNLQHGRINLPINGEYASCDYRLSKVQYNSQAVNSTIGCIWAQQQQNNRATPTSTFQTQNTLNTNTSTQIPSDMFFQNLKNCRPWSIRKSDSFSPGNICMNE